MKILFDILYLAIRKNMKYFLLLLTGLICWIQQAQAYTCTLQTSMTTISTPNITIARSIPIGTEIGNTSTAITPIFSCTNSDPRLTEQIFGVKAVGTYVMNVGNKRIYSTPIKGIGFAVEGYTYNCQTDVWSGWVGDGTNIDGNANNRGLCSIAGILPRQPITGMMNIAYYKTSEVTGSGTVSPGIVAAYILRNNGTWQNESNVSVSSLTITTIPCEVNQTIISVAMGDVEKKQFKGVGTWPDDSNTKNFDIPLTCNPDAKVNVQIDGDIQNASQGVINLTASNNTATGVGVQLLFNDTPLKLGTPFYIGTTTINGLYNIPLQARYYQIANTVTAGEANATATFTLTYN